MSRPTIWWFNLFQRKYFYLNLNRIHIVLLLPIPSDASFREVIKNNQVVLLDFFAAWCGPCKVISPVVSKSVIALPKVGTYSPRFTKKTKPQAVKPWNERELG